MNNVLILFIILSIANVIIQTIKSIATIKCGKGVAALVNAIAFGLYTVVIVYTNADFPLWEKVIITALVNLVGVYLVKYFEEKMQKDKLWKVEMTVDKKYGCLLENSLTSVNIPFSIIETTGKYYIFNIYCETQIQSQNVKNFCKMYNAKYFVSETKNL